MLSTAVDLAGDVIGLAVIVLNQVKAFIANLTNH